MNQSIATPIVANTKTARGGAAERMRGADNAAATAFGLLKPPPYPVKAGSTPLS